MIQTAFFYLFSGTLIGSALMVILGRNPVHSVLFLILAFLNAAGLFLLAGSELLAMIMVMIMCSHARSRRLETRATC